MAAEHLLGHGYRRIGCLTGSARFGPLADRARGCLRTLAASGMSDAVVLRTGLDRHTARQQVMVWLAGPDRPDGIFASGDGLAFDCLTAAHQLGLRTPEDLAVIGFGGTTAAAHHWPALTTVSHPFPSFGQAAVTTLSTVQDRGVRQPDVTLPVELVVRRSCGCVGRGVSDCQLLTLAASRSSAHALGS